MKRATPSQEPTPFWRMPRSLVRRVQDGELTSTQFTLACYLGGAGHDRHGLATTYESLASALRVHKKTIARGLRRLRDLGLVEYELGERQRKPFRVRLGPALRLDASVDMTADTEPPVRVHTGTPDVHSLDASQTQVTTASAASSVGEDGAVVETETETKDHISHRHGDWSSSVRAEELTQQLIGQSLDPYNSDDAAVILRAERLTLGDGLNVTEAITRAREEFANWNAEAGA